MDQSNSDLNACQKLSKKLGETLRNKNSKMVLEKCFGVKIVTISCLKRNDDIFGAKIVIFCSKIRQKKLGFFFIKKKNILARKLLLFCSKIKKIFWREKLLKTK
mgnify:CR=1 FL=1